MQPFRPSAVRVAARVGHGQPAWRYSSRRPLLPAVSVSHSQRPSRRSFQSSAKLQAVQPYILADIGEGITECQIIEWLVKPGDQVEQFDPICEVQSDKAAVEITSRFEGRIEKLHYEVGEMAVVGAPLLDIDVKEGEEEDEATPADTAAPPAETAPSASEPPPQPAAAPPGAATALAEDQVLAMTPIQQQMFQTMTRALAIPHFLFTQKVDLTPLLALRQRLNDKAAAADAARVSVLPFVLKALSAAVVQFPTVNAVVDDAGSATTATAPPKVTLKAAHHFGIAIDTPKGLVVPVVRDVQKHSVRSLGAEIARLGRLARDGRLRPHDLQVASLVVSNIGSIGGSTVAPVILPPMTAIVAIGAVEQVPAFGTDAQGREQIVKQSQVVLSWSADHRVLDGATVARCAKLVADWLETADESKIPLE